VWEVLVDDSFGCCSCEEKVAGPQRRGLQKAGAVEHQDQRTDQSRGGAVIAISLLRIAGTAWGFLQGSPESGEDGRVVASTVSIIGLVLLELRFTDFERSFAGNSRPGVYSALMAADSLHLPLCC
jgi:hypothetical protein